MSISLIIDIAILLIVLVSAGVSFFRGFVREVLTIFGVIGGAVAAYAFGDDLTPVIRGWFGVNAEDKDKFMDLIPYTYLAVICAYGAIFIGVFLVLQLISYFMAASVRAVGLGPVDRSLGVIFGIARALLLLGIFYAALGSIIPEENKKDVLGNSKTIVYVEAVADWIKGFMPGGVPAETKEKVESITRDKFKEIDILGDKKIFSGNESQEDADLDSSSGYKEKDRKKLDSLIENEGDTETDPRLPERSGFND